jgi:hypothetical protein
MLNPYWIDGHLAPDYIAQVRAATSTQNSLNNVTHEATLASGGNTTEITDYTKNRLMQDPMWQQINPNWIRQPNGMWTYNTWGGTGTTTPTAPAPTGTAGPVPTPTAGPGGPDMNAEPNTSGGLVANTGGVLPPTQGGITANTGGVLPPTPITSGIQVNTGGTTPPMPSPTPPVFNTGGGLPPLPGTGPNTGGGLQATTGGVLPPMPVPGQDPQAQPPQTASFAPPAVVNQALDSFINGEYAQNARRRGSEFANTRGLGNSSIAAGASERAALEAVQPLVGQAMGLQNQREQNAFTGDQAERDRQLRSKLQSDATFQQDWLSGRSFTREFNSALAMAPINSAMDFQKQIQTYALENPEVYTQNTISGMTAFFTQNMQSILAKYFPSSYRTGATSVGGQ